MTKEWLRLYEAAKSVLNSQKISEYVEIGNVAAALETEKGNIYVGVCVDTACGLGVCAERNAIFNMLTNGERCIKKIIAINTDEQAIPPCGACREMLAQLMPKDYKSIHVMLDINKCLVVTLEELTLSWWL